MTTPRGKLALKAILQQVGWLHRLLRDHLTLTQASGPKLTDVELWSFL
jgi:hypothetical protein